MKITAEHFAELHRLRKLSKAKTRSKPCALKNCYIMCPLAVRSSALRVRAEISKHTNVFTGR